MSLYIHNNDINDIYQLCLDLVKKFACFCMRGRMWWITFASSQRKGSELGEFLATLELVEAAKLDRTSD